MSSPEYMRRHYGVVPPTGETPRFSTPENLRRRTAEIVGIYEAQPIDISIEKKPHPETPQIQLKLVNDSKIAGRLDWAIGSSSLKASGKRTLKVSDFLVVSDPPQTVV